MSEAIINFMFVYLDCIISKYLPKVKQVKAITLTFKVNMAIIML